MKRKRVPTGYGRMVAVISIKVNKPHDKLFIAKGWEVKSEDQETATFSYTCPNQYQGDDESIVHSLWGDLPKGLEDGQWFIDWDNSAY